MGQFDKLHLRAIKAILGTDSFGSGQYHLLRFATTVMILECSDDITTHLPGNLINDIKVFLLDYLDYGLQDPSYF